MECQMDQSFVLFTSFGQHGGNHPQEVKHTFRLVMVLSTVPEFDRHGLMKHTDIQQSRFWLWGPLLLVSGVKGSRYSWGFTVQQSSLYGEMFNHPIFPNSLSSYPVSVARLLAQH
jgi:hypothetical protein